MILNTIILKYLVGYVSPSSAPSVGILSNCSYGLKYDGKVDNNTHDTYVTRVAWKYETRYLFICHLDDTIIVMNDKCMRTRKVKNFQEKLCCEKNECFFPSTKNYAVKKKKEVFTTV